MLYIAPMDLRLAKKGNIAETFNMLYIAPMDLQLAKKREYC